MKNNHSLLLGAHMSIAGGFEKAIERAESIGCTTLQIFSKSNRQWAAKDITLQEAAAFKKAVAQSYIKPENLVVHATYLINIGSPDQATQDKSIVALINELERCQLLGIPFLVLHPGSHVDSGVEEGLARVAHNLDRAFDQYKGQTMVLLENMAGQGSTLCATFQELATVRNSMRHKKSVGFCFDTCHAFAAGYDFRSEAGYQALWQEFDKILGLENLKAIHLNDSKKECGSRVDRHDDIGKGLLGLKPFELLFNDERFYDVPKILETPSDELADYARNMATIKELLRDDTKEKLIIT